MTTLEAVNAFIEMPDKSWWIVPPDHEDAPTLMVAMVSLSGRMDDATGDDDLKDAVEHCATLISCDVLTTMEIAVEAERIETEVGDYCEDVESRFAWIAQSN